MEIILSTYIFSPNAFDQDQQLFAYLQMQRRGWNFGGRTEDPKVQNYAIGVQSSALRFMMHPVTMARMNNTSLYGNTYDVSEMIEDVIGACFNQDMKGNVNLYRRNLQDAVVKTLININDNKKLPITPEYVFFGLILVSFGPLNIFPNIYPPISVDTQIITPNNKWK